jgi:hypothetical protein
MSQAKSRRTSLGGWIISALLIAASVALWTQRQNVVDAIQYYQYDPSPAIQTVVSKAGLTDDAIFTFYATRPAIESSASFNNHCERREADSPILGCYAANRIYIFDITDDRLDGIETVTAAHELLHAEYDRLPESEQKRLEPLLEAAYAGVSNNKNLAARMEYYAKTQPGQSINELHSIVGTEFAEISPELERHYAQYFNDRQALVALHDKVDGVFKSLSAEADQLVQRIETLVATINSSTEKYNQDVAALNEAVGAFNKRAGQSGGFTTQDEFETARQQLVQQSDALAESRQRIQASIAEYKILLTKLDSINTESDSLNKSLDSVLRDAPQI